ncbi:MAG: sensor histidine kinase protein [Gemmatimonadetes bacterium]|nr:sensor histidine kinase protein [Gemmatimonadota bacterium]
MPTIPWQGRRVLGAITPLLVVSGALVLMTWVAHAVHVRAGPAAVLFASLVVLVSLRGRLAPSLLAALGSVAMWDLFFTGAEVSPADRTVRDIVALGAFCAIAVMVSHLASALRKSEYRWRNVFENNPTMYFIVDKSGTVLSVNPFGAEQLGYVVSELAGESVLKIIDAEDTMSARDHISRCLAHVGTSMSWELRKRHKDGTMLWVRETARAVQLGTEAPVVLIACEDITEQRAAQEKLRRSEGDLRWQASLLDLSHDAIFVRDLQDTVVYWNRGAEEMYGWTSEEVLGRVSHDLTQTIFPVAHEEIRATVLLTGRWDGELVHTKRDGTRIVVASRWSLQRDAAGQAVGVLVTNSDITSRRRAEEDLQHARADLARVGTLTTMGELAASIAHELRQPLAAITMNGSAALRWLNRETPDLIEARDAVSRAVREAQRADEVIRGLRSLLGQSGARREPLDLNPAICEVLELVRSELRRNDVSIRTVLDAELPAAFGDRVQFQQVMLNLVLNGIEAMATVPERPSILRIHTERSGSEAVAVIVEDSGPGLDQSIVERIFDPFFTTKSKGLGLGLSICRSIVEAHGGQLIVSARPAGGTAFRFTVPIAPQTAPAQPTSERQAYA